MKIIKIGNKALFKFSDGDALMLQNISDEDFSFVMGEDDEIKIKEYFNVSLKKFNESVEIYNKAIDEVDQVTSNSKYIKFVDNKYIIPSISEVGVPEYLVKRLSAVEEEGNEDMITTYLNFWTLCCQNPNAEARTNLLWFLEYHGFPILKSGLFSTMRSVKVVSRLNKSLKKFVDKEWDKIKKWKKSPSKYNVYKTGDSYVSIKSSKVVDDPTFTFEGNLDTLKLETNTYTDDYTGTMSISLMSPIRMNRKECDENSENECSAGLHLSHANWSNLGSFGDVVLECLCNPVNVVAVPKRGSYNKIRTCEYYPIKEVERDENNKLHYSCKDGDELNYFRINYNGVVNNDRASAFALKVPSEPTLYKNIIPSIENIYETILNKVKKVK